MLQSILFKAYVLGLSEASKDATVKKFSSSSFAMNFKI
jgi:hypothetical protein